MDKDAVSALSTPELAQFPLDDFFDHYEKGLRKVAYFLTVYVCVCSTYILINNTTVAKLMIMIDIPRRVKGWIDLVGWLHTKMVYRPADGHPSWY